MTPYKVNVRIISATPTPTFNQQINAGEFRSDLYFRMNVVSLDKNY
ncbi:MAG: sigma 54-interacting transcriptional regulator [Methylobacter sp.]|nr:sigma 54-interacting transcriptional regulator [Methylobacter sp.]